MLYALIISAIVGYLCGSINTSIIVGKIKGVDIRKSGSGNAGATNALRVLGKGAAAIVFLFDLLKAFVGIGASFLVVKCFGNSIQNEYAIEYCKYIASLGVILGHNFPLYFGFKGGKGIVSSLAVILFLDWRIGIIIAIASVLVIVFSKYVSLGSMTGAVLYPILVIAFNIKNSEPTVPYYIALSFVMSLLALYRHKANIKRLISGTESKLGQKK